MSPRQHRECRLEREVSWDNWIFVKIAPGKKRGKKKATRSFGVEATINFTSDRLSVWGREVWFGLRGGQLSLVASDGTIPYDFRWPNTKLEQIQVVNLEISEESTSGKSSDSSVGAGVKGAGGDASAKLGTKRSSSSKVTEKKKVDTHHCRISTGGSESVATWSFSSGEGEPYLQGGIVSKEICRILSDSDRCRLAAKFRVRKSDVVPYSGEGLWPEDFNDGKKVIAYSLARRGIFKALGEDAFDQAIAICG